MINIDSLDPDNLDNVVLYYSLINKGDSSNIYTATVNGSD